VKFLPNAEHINTLWQIVNAAGELTRDRRAYLFHTHGPITFYLRAEKADVHIARWELSRVEIRLKLEGKFGWRVAADQDDVGVYLAAHRRRVIGGLSSALFEVVVPQDAYLVLNLTGGRVTLENVNGTLHVPPLNPGQAQVLLAPGDELPLVQN
jgi:hypothetical protein